MKHHRAKLIIILALVLGLTGGAYLTIRGRRPALTPQQAFDLGQKSLQEGRLRDAYGQLEYAARHRPADTEYAWAAAQAAMKLGLIQAASGHAREAWNRGLKNREVFQILVSAVTGDRAARLEKGGAWLRELPDTRERRELEGDLFQSVQSYPECLRIWTELYEAEPAPSLANKIALTRVATGAPGAAHEFLRSCREAGRLDEEGYGLLASLAAYKDDAQDAAAVLAEGRARFPSSESLQITEAVFLIWRDRLSDAAALLEPLKARAADPAKAALHAQARVFLGFLRAAQADAAALETLTALAAGEGPELEGERLFYQGLKVKSAETLKKARLLMTPHPACDWTLARELARTGAWKDSVEAYRRMSGLLAGSPVLQVELAHALLRSGRAEESLAALRKLHARRYYTKASLEMVRDLASLRGLKAEAEEAQAFLEKRFGEDPAVGMAGGVLALHAGNLSQAASILDRLSARHPGREDVELAKLSVLFAGRDYEGVLKAAAASSASPASLAPIQAASYVMLGRHDDAASLYERILATSSELPTILSYANLLLRLDRLDHARAKYGEVLKLHPANSVAHLGLATAAARRRDWKTARTHAEAAASGPTEAYAQGVLAEIDLDEGRPDRAVARCTKALALDPGDERANFLFGVCCLELGRYDEAETTLRRLAGERPEAGYVLLSLARVGLARGAFGEALAVVDGALERKFRGDLSFQAMRMVLLARMGRESEARDQFSLIAPQLPPERAALCDAWLLHREGRLPEAASRLRDHLQDTHAAVYWAELALMEGGSDGVLEVLDRHTLDAARWGKLGELARQKGLLSLAAQCYRRALRFDAENPQLLNNYAYASLQLDSFDETEVLAAAKKVASILPGNPSIVHTYAAALLRCRKERECVELLDKSPALTQKSARLLHALATAHERLEHWGPAMKSYEACLVHPETEGVAAGDLARASIKRRIEHVRARSEKR
jgi:tetratricopeptide (TPR) repeat protein